MPFCHAELGGGISCKSPGYTETSIPLVLVWNMASRKEQVASLPHALRVPCSSQCDGGVPANSGSWIWDVEACE